VGYQRPLIRLVFDDTNGDLSGLEVTVRRMAIKHVRTIASMAGVSTDVQDEGDLERMQRAVALLADHLVSWNLEDEDDLPVPCTREGLEGQDMGFIQGILSAWMDQAIGVAPPLPQPSADGDPFPVESIPMTDLPSLSLPS
jgi:hypothetical protein